MEKSQTLTPNEWCIMELLWENPQTLMELVGKLSECQGWSKSTVATMVRRMEEKGLISSEGADAGMFHTVDGEEATWEKHKAYWALYIGEEYAVVGIYDTPVTDGAVYKLVYTLG